MGAQATFATLLALTAPGGTPARHRHDPRPVDDAQDGDLHRETAIDRFGREVSKLYSIGVGRGF